MEFNPQTFIARLKERFVSWRPTVSEISHDYRDIATDFRTFFRRSSTLARGIFYAVLLLIGIGLGIGSKLAAESGLTIGHEDYRLVPAERLYALNALREQALEKGAALPVSEKRSYPACSVRIGLDEL